MSAKRILFIMHMPPPVHGAAMMGKYILESKRINREYECSFINLSTAHSLSDVGSFRLQKVIEIVKQYNSIIRALGQTNPDLVYMTPNSHGAAFFKEFLFVQKIKKRGFPIVAHFHNKGVSTHQNNPIYDFLYRRFFNKIRVILLSKYLYGDVGRYVSLNNISFCPNGIPSVAVRQRQPSDDAPHILFLSNLLKSKGVIELLDACSVMKNRGVSFICDIVGKETAEISGEVLESEIKARSLEESVIYHGAKYGEDKDVFLSLSNVFVLPSLDECFPLVLLEAMQHSIPVVATEEGGIPDIVEDGKTGFIVPKHDVSALADKVEYLINNPDLSYSMGQTGLKKYREEFQLEMWENRLCNILKSLCN